MRYRALATDYDGTLAHDGRVDDVTVDALHRVRDAGLPLIMVTGRELTDLFNTFEHVEAFDRIVAENGAVLYNPATKDIRRPLRWLPQVPFWKLSTVKMCRFPLGTPSSPRWNHTSTRCWPLSGISALSGT